jgi:hypothetical protein
MSILLPLSNVRVRFWLTRAIHVYNFDRPDYFGFHWHVRLFLQSVSLAPRQLLLQMEVQQISDHRLEQSQDSIGAFAV